MICTSRIGISPFSARIESRVNFKIGAVRPERVDEAFRFVQDRGVQFHWQEPGDPPLELHRPHRDLPGARSHLVAGGELVPGSTGVCVGG